jgi:hypothetical protein
VTDPVFGWVDRAAVPSLPRAAAMKQGAAMSFGIGVSDVIHGKVSFSSHPSKITVAPSICNIKKPCSYVEKKMVQAQSSKKCMAGRYHFYSVTSMVGHSAFSIHLFGCHDSSIFGVGRVP